MMSRLDSHMTADYYQQSFSGVTSFACGPICPEFMIKLGKL